jgi:hypothetical protein
MWTASSGAENYTVYLSSSFITEINGSLTVLADNIVVQSMALSGYANGTYYFIVVARNSEGDTLSNCIEITVQTEQPPGAFTLSSNAGNPDTDGNFDLMWTSSSGADDYTVYRSSSFITTITGSLTLLADDISALSMALSGYTDGTYYFIIVAHNSVGETLSNCISITVAKEGGLPEIPGYDVMLIGAVLGIAIALVIKKKHRK